MVIHIKAGEPYNARPCHKCLEMMRAVGIRKVYYSVSATEIVCENVKDMISIQSSSLTKHIEKLRDKVDIDNPELYYENLLKKKFPDVIKIHNLKNFVKHNLVNVLPNFKIKYHSINGSNFVLILNSKNICIIKSKLII